MEPLGILGGGAFGCALADLVSARGGDVVLWEDDPARLDLLGKERRSERLPGVVLGERVAITSDLAVAAGRARLLLLVVPSLRIAELAGRLGAVVNGGHRIVHAAAAFVPHRGALVSAATVLRAETCTRRIGALAGPSPPRELAARRPCTLVVASLYDEVVRAAQEVLGAPPCLRVYASHDLVGVELGSVLASAFAVGLGVAEGAGAGPGARAALLCRGVAEATRLIVAQGGRERTFAGLAGLGNLLVRLGESDGDYAIDYRHGLALGRGERPETGETEGTRAAVGAVGVARALNVRLPILEGLAALVAGDVGVGDATVRLVSAAATEE